MQCLKERVGSDAQLDHWLGFSTDKHNHHFHEISPLSKGHGNIVILEYYIYHIVILLAYSNHGGIFCKAERPNVLYLYTLSWGGGRGVHHQIFGSRVQHSIKKLDPIRFKFL